MTPTRKPFDAATKQLVGLSPGDWLAYLGLSGSGAEMIEAEVSTVAAQADRVLCVQADPSPYLAHVEFQASYAADMGERMLRYNVLLRRDADGPAMTGVSARGKRPTTRAFCISATRSSGSGKNPSSRCSGAASRRSPSPRSPTFPSIACPT